jgi:uncharacterized protein YodC (DUF2158 family)
MAAEQFNVGDVVRLKSGGPKMTVTKVDSKWITCNWFEGNKVHVDMFPSGALEKAQDD